VGGPKTRGLRRGIAFAAVVALHAARVLTSVRTHFASVPNEFNYCVDFLSAPLLR